MRRASQLPWRSGPGLGLRGSDIILEAELLKVLRNFSLLK